MASSDSTKLSSHAKDRRGEKHGKLTVLEFAGRKGSNIVWRCLCECGQFTEVRSGGLATGTINSCGCMSNRTHGRSRTMEYRIWGAMKTRCTNTNAAAYQYYGGRGITVCDRWIHSFENFLADMGFCMYHGGSIDRIDCNGNYEPDNCRWATARTQSNTSRKARMITYNGVTQSMSDWARHVGISYYALRSRMQRGWTSEQALTTPPRRLSKHAIRHKTP